MYCAIIADIIKSREIVKRAETQMKLNEILKDINQSYKEDIVSKFTITIGDEFQGLLSTPQNIMNILDYIKKEFYPIKLRFGIGFGDIYTEINSELAIGADGPAYHAARKAIEEVKQSNHKYEQPLQDILLKQEPPEIGCNFNLINAGFSTCTFIESKWSEKQREVINRLGEADISQRELAETLNLDQSSVQRRLNVSGYFTYKYMKTNISETIINIWEAINDK